MKVDNLLNTVQSSGLKSKKQQQQKHFRGGRWDFLLLNSQISARTFKQSKDRTGSGFFYLLFFPGSEMNMVSDIKLSLSGWHVCLLRVYLNSVTMIAVLNPGLFSFFLLLLLIRWQSPAVTHRLLGLAFLRFAVGAVFRFRWFTCCSVFMAPAADVLQRRQKIRLRGVTTEGYSAVKAA